MSTKTQKTKELLKAEGFDALLISSSFNIRYLTCFDGFSADEREGFALVTNSNMYIFADPRLSEGARKNSKGASVIEFSAGKKLLPQIQEIIDREKVKILGFEENLTYSEFKRFKKLKVKLKMVEEIVEDVRTIKDASELKSLKRACELTDDAFQFALGKIKAGITELGLAWEMEKFIRENRGELAFPTIVAFGSNSATPHHKTSSQKLVAGSCILLDFGAKIDGYCADMTRTVFFGKAPEKFKEIYDTVRIAQEKAFKPKKFTAEEVDKTARDYITHKKFPTIPHSVGHGVGLEVHELPHISPSFTERIEPNTPFTIEPGIYVNGYGGVRIEDTVYYDGKKIISLTKSPKELIELN